MFLSRQNFRTIVKNIVRFSLNWIQAQDQEFDLRVKILIGMK